jgi:hypothetical protein
MNEDYISLKEAAVILGKSVPATRATIKRHGVQTISVNGKHGIELRVNVHGLETLRDNARTAAKSKVGTSDTSKGAKPPRKGAQTENSEINNVNPWEELAQAKAEISDLKATIKTKDAQLDEARKDYVKASEDHRAAMQEKEQQAANMLAALVVGRSAADTQPKAIEPRTWLDRLLRRD